MRSLLAVSSAIFMVAIISQSAVACDADKLASDMKWCLQSGQPGFSDMVLGGCIKNAEVIGDGFRICQHEEDVRKNYESCTVEQRVGTIRSIATAMQLYKNPGKCGF